LEADEALQLLRSWDGVPRRSMLAKEELTDDSPTVIVERSAALEQTLMIPLDDVSRGLGEGPSPA
jgi:hypothetical protein